MSAPDANKELGQLLTEARKLRDNYGEALERYGQETTSKQIIAGFAINYFELPEEVSNPGLKLFLRKWEVTQDYKALYAGFEQLCDRVRTFLNTVSEQTKTLRWPGNSKKLLAKLRPIGGAVRIDTKIRRLVAALEDLSMRDLTYNMDLPKRRPESHKGERGRMPAAASKPQTSVSPASPSIEQQAWGLLGIFISVAVAIAVGLGSSGDIGWGGGILIGIALAAIVTLTVALTWPHWVSLLGRLQRREAKK